MLDLQKMRSLGSKLKIQLIKGPSKGNPTFLNLRTRASRPLNFQKESRRALPLALTAPEPPNALTLIRRKRSRKPYETVSDSTNQSPAKTLETLNKTPSKSQETPERKAAQLSRRCAQLVAEKLDLRSIQA